MLQRLLLVVAGLLLLVCLYFFFWRSSSELPPAEELAERSLAGATEEERAKAVVRLSYHLREADTKAKWQTTVEQLRRVFRESKEAEVRAAAVRGLGLAKDHHSMDELLQAMADPSPLVRARAAGAVMSIVGRDRRFKASAPEDERQQVIAAYRKDWEQLKNSPLLESYTNSKETLHETPP